MEQLSANKFKFDLLPDWAESAPSYVSLKRFGGERALELEPKLIVPSARFLVKLNMLAWGNDDFQLRQYTKTPRRSSELGSFEHEYIFYKRPPFNQLDININYSGLNPIASLH